MTLHDYYWSCFLASVALVTVLQIYSRSQTRNEQKAPTDSKFVLFQRWYLVAFLLSMFADWLQGPYIYELYVSYGFNKEQIAELFLGGYVSSMLCGTFVGGMADKFGRKTMCLLYCLFYGSACVTKLVPDYNVLMLGRFLSGISTSLLFSVFEAWMVCEHHKQGFDSALLADTFSHATFGNGVVAAVAGLTANIAAHFGGFVSSEALTLLPVFVLTSCPIFLFPSL